MPETERKAASKRGGASRWEGKTEEERARISWTGEEEKEAVIPSEAALHQLLAGNGYLVLRGSLEALAAPRSDDLPQAVPEGPLSHQG